MLCTSGFFFCKDLGENVVKAIVFSRSVGLGNGAVFFLDHDVALVQLRSEDGQSTLHEEISLLTDGGQVELADHGRVLVLPLGVENYRWNLCRVNIEVVKDFSVASTINPCEMEW